MPTYEYECRVCKTRAEAFQKITAPPLTTCESCGGSLRRVLFPVGIVFKGSGFYVTDYKNKENAKNGSTNGASHEAKSSDKSETSAKSETKPATEKKETTATTSE